MKKENIYKLIVPAFALVVLLAISVGILVYQQSKNNKADALGSFDVDRKIIATSSPFYLDTTTASATTSMTILLRGVATSTYTWGIDRADSVELNFVYFSTSTSLTLAWNYKFSYDGVNYFGEDINTTSGALVTHNGDTASSTITHQWTIATSSPTQAVFKNIRVNPSGVLLGAKFMRLDIACQGSAGHCKWWGEAIMKRPVR